MKAVTTVVLVSALVSGVSVAQEDEPKTEGAAEAPKVETSAAAQAAFTTLPLCRLVEGLVEVRKPGGEWERADEGKFYPLGCSYRTVGEGRLELCFGKDSRALICGDAEFGTRQQDLGVKSRTVVLVRGSLELDLASNLPEGAFFVTTPDFVVKNLAGKSRYVYEDKGDGVKVTVRCVTGTVGAQGRHFDIPAMRAADEVIIRGSHDHLSTMLYCTSGDYLVKLDQGIATKDEIGDDGSIKKVVEKSAKDWRLSPATKVIINRALPSIGERMSVHTMAFDAAGALKSECSFCEGRAEINSGELVARDKSEGEDLAKRAAEATETTAVAAEEESNATEGKENNKNENSNQE